MFDLYLGYVLKDSDALTHPLSRSVFGVVQTRNSSAEGQALASAVAVESVLDKFYSSVANPDATFVNDVDELIKHLRSWPTNRNLVDRVVGSIGGFKRARPDDRLRSLVASNVVGEAEREAWKKLRNTSAHGDWHEYDGKLQELLDLTGKVACLLNQLIFHLIGYSGKQTNYGTHGWPAVDYPPNADRARAVASPSREGKAG
jgi:hypothetical protein